MIKPYVRRPRLLRFSTYDLEWIPETYAVTLAGVYDGERYTAYRDVDAFLDGVLTASNSGRVFFAHNGGASDIQFLLSSIIRSGKYRVEGSWAQSSLIICRVTEGGYRWTFADSCWLIRSSLRKIGEGLGQLKGGEDYKCARWPACGHAPGKCIFYGGWSVLRDYNERDCTILYNAIEALEAVVLELGGQLELTIASTALKLFRSSYLKEPIGTTRAINRQIASSYIGSRVEVYASECGPASIYDVNSSFPYSMTKALPGDLLRSNKTFKESHPLSVVDAAVTVPDMYVPPLPVKRGGRVYFPTGSFRRWFTGEDLLLCLEFGGRIERVYAAHHYHARDDLERYVRDIYDIRSRETGFRRVLYKILLNSLYGKMGEGEIKESLLVNPAVRPKCGRDPEMGCTGEACRCVRMYGPGIYRVKTRRSIPHTHIPIAAVTTSRSRSILARQLRESAACGEVYYCDTDSIVATVPPRDVGPALGQWKLERVLQRGSFLSPKLYAYVDKDGESHVKAKGFRALSLEDFERVKNGESVRTVRMKRLKELYASGLTEPEDKVVNKASRSHRLDWRDKPKRRPIYDASARAYTTRPWIVRELDDD